MPRSRRSSRSPRRPRTGRPPVLSTAQPRDQAQPLAYQLKVTLTGSKPPIWRRFSVPGEITLDRLHDVLQIVIGWEDKHLHRFEIDGKAYSEKPEEEFEGQEEGGCRLGALINKRMTFSYIYDYGDDWHHTVVVEKISPVPEKHMAVVVCLSGKNHCPPEDVGGLEGYEEFLEALDDPEHEMHEQYRDWLGAAFDPKAFDVDAVNLELARYARWSRPRKIWDDV